MRVRLSLALSFSALAALAPDLAGAALLGGDSLDVVETQITYGRAVARTQAELPQVMNLSDCANDIEVTFPLRLRTTGTRQLEVWAGPQECTGTESSEPSSFCERVTNQAVTTDTRQVVLRVRDLLQRSVHSDDCTENDQGQGEARAEILTFAFTDPDSGRPADSEQTSEYETYELKWDLRGPSGPSIKSAGAGESSAYATWDTLESTDVVGYRVCALASSSSGAGGTSGSGNLGEAGESGFSADPNCPSGLVPGEIPSLEHCGGQVGASSGRGTVAGLQNNQLYAVGVVAVDAVGNIGTLSSTVCAEPREVTDFFEMYRQAGGKGGGGYCSMGARKMTGLGWGWTLGAALVLLRRRRP